MAGTSRLCAALALLALSTPAFADDAARELPGIALPPLPEPISNNAVAVLDLASGPRLYSFLGLGPGKTWRDVSGAAFEHDVKRRIWSRLSLVPGPPRLASVAVGLGDSVYIFGGYTVNEKGDENSRAEVYAWQASKQRYARMADMPAAVDDSQALAYAGRYVYLVSGWHDTGNVAAVQVYDIQSDQWRQATPYPGVPVFGHAAGIVGNRMVVSDGVKVVASVNGKNHYQISDESWLGEISPDDPGKITWSRLPRHPGGAKYRMAAAGDEEGQRILFAGGSENPYNYDGIGYDKRPSPPSAQVFAYDLKSKKWHMLGNKRPATMDHRSLLKLGKRYVTIGGMDDEQKVTVGVAGFSAE